MSKKRVANLYLPTDTVEALDKACEEFPFNRSELANMAIRQGLAKTLERFRKLPKIQEAFQARPEPHTEPITA